METQPTTSSPWLVRDPIFVYLAALLASAAGLVIAGVTGFIDLDDFAEEDQLPRVIMVAAAAQFGAMYLGLKWLSSRKGTGDLKEDFHLHVSGSDFPFFLYGIGLLFVSGLALAGILAALDIEQPTQEVIEAAQSADNFGEKIVIVLVITVLAPILEEMLFRGALLDALKARMSLNGAIWTTGVVFGLVHLADPATLVLVPALIGLGVILGFVRERGGGSLSRPILMHMGFNAVTAFFLVFSL